MHDGIKDLGKSIDDNLKNVEGRNDVREGFHGLRISSKINTGRGLWEFFFDEIPKTGG